MYQLVVKRFFDAVFSFVALIVASPILLLGIVWSYAAHGSVWFVQERAGWHGKPFRIYKLKTMRDAVDQYGDPLSDDVRLTAVGRVMRKLSIDELPQLVNVLKGDMSIVGPRPLLMEYLPLYNSEQNRRHSVRPGITGWAQINGRNAIGWPKRFELDVWYTRNISFLLDLKILILTPTWVFFRPRGISGPGTATMTKFRGNK
jgi:lipopolysaccharide/colanic/teichoic acid biosynthesis glycosyltransferase